MKKILAIAGFDPSSGAGITMDLNIFQNNGFHGISIPTCTVVQGPFGVSEVYPTPYEAFSYMLNEIKDMEINGVKLGVLYDEPYIEKIVSFIKTLPDSIPIVLDPIVASKNNTELLTQRGILKLKESLMPFVTVITPNIDEAEILTDTNIKDAKSMERAAIKLFNEGAKTVIIKGGHLKTKPVDIIFDGKEVIKYMRDRTDKEVHGTGCAFSSLLTSYMCLGYPVQEAFFAAENDMNKLLEKSYKISDQGYYYMSLGAIKSVDSEKWAVIEALKQTKELLYELNPIELVPAVQMNIGYALKDAKTEDDVAAFPGRISVHEKKVYFKGEPCFGASSHIARLILNMMKKYPFIRSCANIKYNEQIIKRAKIKHMHIIYFDRKTEPDDIKQREGKSLEFLMNNVLPNIDTPPDIIYDTGDMGKEPMIRLFGKNPIEIIKKMEMMLK